MRKLVLTLTLAAASMGVAIAAPYTPTGPNHSSGTTLGQLLTDGGYLKIGDKIFDHFQWEKKTDLCPGCVVADNPNGLTVEVGYDLNGNYAISFSGALGIVNGVANGGLLDYNLFYQVHTDSGLSLIKGITQQFGGMNVHSGLVGFSEQARSLPGNSTLGSSAINWVALAGQPDIVDAEDPPGEAGDILSFAPQSGVQVFKDLTFYADARGWAYVSRFTQGFSQVPEPGFYGALAIGLSGLMFLKRRKQAE